MSSAHLTAKYRPQCFAEVAGQEALKAVLSRAAKEDRIAPAYLFSGTRGVGKTTLARILAKAVNCEHAPTAEPCNQCRHCRQITAGAAVDVVEIDAASNRGIDDARRLKEDIGYAPLECRYKVFIIDEAHMLTREAFNALLKTLEEPPGRVTFILATTEPHKFPATIISRCQHYAFKRLGQAELEAHLKVVLGKEGVDCEDAAVSLIARRGAGSVRDSMSLLGQALALGGRQLVAQEVRSLLGLAGQDVFLAVMEAIHTGDCIAAGEVIRQVLDQGLDLGFFLRELSSAWRNMFLLKQGGERALPLIDLPESEARQWLDWAERFDLGRIHASWQLTLEGQRRVLRSLEPALALELLLFNLCSLPQLLRLSAACASGGTQAGSPAAPGRPGGQGGQSRSAPAQSRQGFTPPARSGVPGASGARQPGPAVQSATHAADGFSNASAGSEEPESNEPPPAEPPPGHALAVASLDSTETETEPAASLAGSLGPRTWEGFLAWVDGRAKETGQAINGARMVPGEVEGDMLQLYCRNETHCRLVTQGREFSVFKRYVEEYFGPGMRIEATAKRAAPRKSLKELREEIREHPLVKQVVEEFDAQIVDIRRPEDR
ncbi:DNA polymerase III, tau subunit [Desulfocurvibacter africanus PCS]|uniref:DNA polymerase III subunit gamma/tau n=1 Tax=Desulfocurvibacter africanus PCS TaxID=1262666 RepID=M5Q316_DESAF|nr:DNA polymerase III subunit gamma/tau [Desulfocurvibacter africanus]EMG38956.1 DNA polymerase III, tau subunit [Desulfocurvibacter africanus PCS]